MLKILVLGSGCVNCKRVEEVSRKIIDQLAIEAEVVKVTDYNDILAHGVMNTPGLVINDEVVCTGRIPSEAEVTTWITTALDTG